MTLLSPPQRRPRARTRRHPRKGVRTADEGLGLRRATALLLELRNRGAEQLVRCVVSAARHHRHPAFATVAELAHFHPLDPGVIVSILLNRITLQRPLG